MSGDLSVFNRQRAQPLNRAALRNILAALLQELAPDADYDLTVHILGAKAMTALNQTALHHAGSTDVITFDYSGRPQGPLAGEIHVCLEEAVAQAARFRTTWPDELARYLIHGLLHLRGYNDTRPATRRRMKRAEARLLQTMRRRFDLRKLRGKPQPAPVNTDHFSRWRANFFTGLAIVLPAIISLTVIFWLFFTVSGVTDKILIFVPKEYTHESGVNGPGTGPVHWYWSVVALALVIFLVSIVGLLARYYMGKKLIESVDTSLLRVPLLNKIYGATKQVNEAFISGDKTSFKTVVLVEFPRAGMYSVGFLTSEQRGEIQMKTGQRVVGVFIPTTPNPTSGFLVLVPEDAVTKLEMSVADGIKFIISLGAISPDYLPAQASAQKAATGGSES